LLGFAHKRAELAKQKRGRFLLQDDKNSFRHTIAGYPKDASENGGTRFAGKNIFVPGRPSHTNQGIGGGKDNSRLDQNIKGEQMEGGPHEKERSRSQIVGETVPNRLKRCGKGPGGTGCRGGGRKPRARDTREVILEKE